MDEIRQNLLCEYDHCITVTYIDEAPDSSVCWFSLQKLSKQFLSNSRQTDKFHFPLITDIMLASPTDAPKFDAKCASICFRGCEQLALNLLLFPWRSDYAEIQSSSKFWQEDVRNCLSAFEAVLELIGYLPDVKCALPAASRTFNTASKWCLHSRSTRPMLLKIAFDCYLAQIEFETMHLMRNYVADHFNVDPVRIHWLDVVSCRTGMVGNVQQCSDTMKANLPLKQALQKVVPIFDLGLNNATGGRGSYASGASSTFYSDPDGSTTSTSTIGRSKFYGSSSTSSDGSPSSGQAEIRTLPRKLPSHSSIQNTSLRVEPLLPERDYPDSGGRSNSRSNPTSPNPPSYEYCENNGTVSKGHGVQSKLKNIKTNIANASRKAIDGLKSSHQDGLPSLHSSMRKPWKDKVCPHCTSDIRGAAVVCPTCGAAVGRHYFS